MTQVSPLGPAAGPMLGCLTMSTLLTKRRAVDLCRVATCLCHLS